MAVFSGGGGDGQNHATKGVSDFGAPYLQNVAPEGGGGGVIHILKPLEKGFQNMYGFGGQGRLRKKLWPAEKKWSGNFPAGFGQIG